MSFTIQFKVSESDGPAGPFAALFNLERKDELWFRLILESARGKPGKDEVQQLVVFRNPKGGYTALNYGAENGALNFGYKQLHDTLQLGEHMTQLGFREEHFAMLNRAAEANGYAERLVYPSLVDNFCAGLVISQAAVSSRRNNRVAALLRPPAHKAG
jgi:hypothetical protein